jgi:hypothetical protein
MTERKFVTVDQFYAWMGSDTLKVHDLTELLLEVINGHYPVQVLREDVLSYETEEETK